MGRAGATARQGTGSQRALRDFNRQRIVDALATNGPTTQADLARLTGLSTATVSNIVKRMGERNLVRTSPTTSSGRRAQLVHLNHTDRYAVAIDLGRRHLRLLLADVGHKVMAEDVRALELEYEADDGIATAVQMLEVQLKRLKIKREQLVGCGVGLPGPIHWPSKRVVAASILPNWEGVDIETEISRALGIPAYADNDANLGALAESTWGARRGVNNLVFVKVGTGIGAGLILNGQLHRGHIGVAGEIGHNPISDLGPACTCGNRGCLESVASTRTLLRALGPRAGTEAGTDELLRILHSGDQAGLRLLEDAAEAVGRAMAAVCNLLNPEYVILGGPLANLGSALQGPVQRSLARHAVPIVAENTRVEVSSLGDRAEALGALSLVFQQTATEAFAAS